MLLKMEAVFSAETLEHSQTTANETVVKSAHGYWSHDSKIVINVTNMTAM